MYSKNRITVLYTPYKQFRDLKPVPREANPTSYLLTIDLYRLSQTPIIVPVTSAVFTSFPISTCASSTSQHQISTTTFVCYLPVQRQLIQLPEHLLTPPLSETISSDEEVAQADSNPDQRPKIPLLHQIQHPLPYEFILSGEYLLDPLLSAQLSDAPSIIITPTQYESTNSVFYLGTDLFHTTLIRDGSFDQLNNTTFNHWLLLGTIALVLVTFLYSKHRARVVQLQNQWK